ncbi:hypothetical protein [Alienimonas chondri]|uniref:Uncharacterized protein n=1 Tax=Alienimonas chondri TaxID=2681879 RepID=A0ABX1VCM8_9PLAN|nr:hypothetical protein [Alienimonas chondri]NNJ25176.1 hypothetical protein [Alienimonas chondri]
MSEPETSHSASEAADVSAGRAIFWGVVAVTLLLSMVGLGIRLLLGKPLMGVTDVIRWALTAGLLWGLWRGSRTSRALLAICFGLGLFYTVGPALRGDLVSASLTVVLGGQVIALMSSPVGDFCDEMKRRREV